MQAESVTPTMPTNEDGTDAGTHEPVEGNLESDMAEVIVVDDGVKAQPIAVSVKEEEEAEASSPAREKPVIEPIYYNLEPSPTADSALKAKVVEERKKQLNRILRFSSPDKGVSISAVTETSVLGARRAAIRRGFATGFDTTSPEETLRRQARIARFGPPESHPFFKSDEDASARAARTRRFGSDAMDDVAKLCSENTLEIKRVVQTGEQPRENVLHLHGVDQLTTKEVVKHFSQYGPSWCEWLNDSNCNVAFEDGYSMSRALRGMSIGSTPTGTPSQSMDTMNEMHDDDMKAPVTKDEIKKDEDVMEVIGNTDVQEDLLFRPVRPFVRKGRFVTLWGRMATTVDVRPEKPNPQSKWARTINRREKAKSEPHEASSTPRKSDGSKKLGVNRGKRATISKPLPRKSSKMDIDRALSSS